MTKLIRSRYIISLIIAAVFLAGQGFGSTETKRKRTTAQKKSATTKPKATANLNQQKPSAVANSEVSEAATFIEDGISRLQVSLDCNC